MGARNTGNMMPDDSSEQQDAHGAEEDTRAFLTQPFPSLGERLAREAHRIVSHRIPVFPWLRPLETTIEHLTSLPLPAQERFQRTETPPASVAFLHTGSDVEGNALGTLKMPGRKAEATREGQPLSPQLQQRLQTFVGHGTEMIRVHDDESSHAIAQTQRADAVTMGTHIFFGQGHFRPQEDTGFALLAHEALHVTRAMQPGRAWRRATQMGIQEEEQEAEALENRVLHARRNASWGNQSAPAPQRPAYSPLPVGDVAPTIPSTPAQHPMRAATGRSLEDSTGSPAMPDLDAWKRTLYRDLMRQIKADLERGG